MPPIDLRQSKRTWLFVFIISVIFCAVSFIVKLEGAFDYAMMVLVVLMFGMLGIGVSAYNLFIAKGRSGLQFFTDHVRLELANGKFWDYPLASITMIGLQNLTLPGYAQAIVGSSPTNNMALGIKFTPGTEIPETGRADSYLFTKNKLDLWTDENKLDVYLSLMQIDEAKLVKLKEWWLKMAGSPVQDLPPLILK